MWILVYYDKIEWIKEEQKVKSTSKNKNNFFYRFYHIFNLKFHKFFKINYFFDTTKFLKISIKSYLILINFY